MSKHINLTPIGLFNVIKVTAVRRMKVRMVSDTHGGKRPMWVGDKSFKAMAWKPKELHEFWKEMLK